LTRFGFLEPNAVAVKVRDQPVEVSYEDGNVTI
jgi:hypothetical protein